MQRHRMEVSSLLFGLLFAGAGLLFLIREEAAWRVDWGWLWPIAALVAALLVLASLRPDRGEEPAEPVPSDLWDSDTDDLR